MSHFTSKNAFKYLESASMVLSALVRTTPHEPRSPLAGSCLGCQSWLGLPS